MAYKPFRIKDINHTNSINMLLVANSVALLALLCKVLLIKKLAFVILIKFTIVIKVLSLLEKHIVVQCPSYQCECISV